MKGDPQFMRIQWLVAVGVLAFASLAAAQESKAVPSLKVKLNYKGAGTVDAKHKIFIFVFDTPDFMQGNGMPVASDSATAKDQTVTFSGLTAPVVYVVAAFDPSGTYDGVSGPPPAGSSMGMYSKEPGKPAPVNLESGKTAEIELAFDDSVKMQ
jgi:hypothetical protein